MQPLEGQDPRTSLAYAPVGFFFTFGFVYVVVCLQDYAKTTQLFSQNLVQSWHTGMKATI